MDIGKHLLFGLALVDSLMRDFSDVGGIVSFSYKNLYGFVPQKYKRKSVYKASYSLKKRKYIFSLTRGKFLLTDEGKEIVFENFPLLQFANKAWDGKWRIVGFDIEEKDRKVRNVLRKFLRLNGFCMVQESLYVSPLPLEEKIASFFSSHKQVLENAYIFVSEGFFFGDREEFVDKVFSISKINTLYKNLLERIKEDMFEEEKNNVKRDFLQISMKDPFLPTEFLPKDFARRDVWRALLEKNILIQV